METYTVIGYRPYSFKGTDGRDIDGMNLYCSYEMSGVTGESCIKLSVSSASLGGYAPMLGDKICVSYNRYGKVAGIQYAD